MHYASIKYLKHLYLEIKKLRTPNFFNLTRELKIKMFRKF